MDHIPLVEKSSLKNFQVPVVCEGFENIYDNLGFHDSRSEKDGASLMMSLVG
jgi:hypothetical protein